MRLDGPYYAKPTEEEISRTCRRIEEWVKDGGFPDPKVRMVLADAVTDRFVGTVSRYWQSQETHWLSVGIVLFDPQHWGKGLGYQGLGMWCGYLLKVMPELLRLDLRTWSGNIGMMKLAEKLGFVEEARFRNARIVEGEVYDGMGYGILREEWETRYPEGFGKA